MADYLTNTTELTAVADAIRGKTGDSGNLIFPNGFVSAIEEISGGSSSYNITINLTNPINANHCHGIAVYAIIDDAKDSVGNFENTEYILTISNPESSTTITLDAFYYGISIVLSGLSVNVPSEPITTGKIGRFINGEWSGEIWDFLIGSDGTITYDQVDYDD